MGYSPIGGGDGGISLLDVYPVGAIYISVVSTSPATLFGGTWSAIGAGRVLVGIDAGDADFDTVEETGGAKTVQSSAQTFAGSAMATHQHDALSAGTPSGTNSAPSFTGTPSTVIVNHTHNITSLRGSSTGSETTVGSGLTAGVDSSSGSVGHATGNPQSGGAANYTPAGTVSAPTFTGNALGTHQHNALSAGTPAGTNTPGAATSVVQPYLVVHMWKRTA